MRVCLPASVPCRTATPRLPARKLLSPSLCTRTTDIGDVYNVEFPPQVRNLLNSFSFAVSLGLGGVGRVLECLDMHGYVPTLALYVTVPPVVGAAVVLCGAARLAMSAPRSERTPAALLSWSAPYLMKLIFIFYPLVTSYAFRAFSCYEFIEGGWLKEDVSIRCGTDQHSKSKALAWAAIILYPIGLLLLNATLLFAARQAILVQKPSALSHAIGFLHRE